MDHYLTSIAGLVIMLGGTVRDARSRSMLAGLLVAFGLAWASTPFWLPQAVQPSESFGSRSLNGILPLVLGACVVAEALRFRDPPGEQYNWEIWTRWAVVCAAVAGTCHGLWDLGATWRWSQYLALFQAEIERPPAGLRALADTRMAVSYNGSQPIRCFYWGWTGPTQSVLMAKQGRVRVIVDNPRSGFSPWDPTNPDTLPRIHGFDYSDYLAALAKESRPMGKP